jgi:hypothetical protein
MSREGSHSFYRAASGELVELSLVCEFVPPNRIAIRFADILSLLMDVASVIRFVPLKLRLTKPTQTKRFGVSDRRTETFILKAHRPSYCVNDKLA